MNYFVKIIKMTKKSQIYKCNVCGNIIEVLHEGADALVCCGQPMQLMAENIIDASKEKHIPVIERNEEGVIIKVGSETHPMTEEHFIEWIEISTEKGESKKFLKPGEEPEAMFPVKAENIKSRCYCNIHGLWKSEN